MLKGVVGVIAGYMVFAISAVALFQVSRRDPHRAQDMGFVVFSVLYGMAFAFAGGYLAAAVAGRKPRQHAAAVALILALGATVSFLAQPGAGSRWSQIAALVLMTPSAFAGGVVRSKGSG
jgi:predicted membrane protein